MESRDLSFLIKTRKSAIFTVALIFLILVLIATFIQPLKYRSTTKILVTQNYGLASDAYSVSKSNQFISNVLAQIIYSDIFFDDVMKSGYNIDQNYFSADDSKKKKQWQNMVTPVVLNDAGVIIVHTYHQDKYQANQINQAIAYVLKTKHAQYHGMGSKISVKVIDKSINSRFPVKPNIILNALFGIIIGIVLGIIFVHLYPEKRQKPVQKAEIAKQPHFDEAKEAEVKKESIGEAPPGYFDDGDEFNEDEIHEINGNIKNILS